LVRAASRRYQWRQSQGLPTAVRFGIAGEP